MSKDMFLTFCAACILASCATPYQEIGESATGGHTFQRLSEDEFEVSFLGNGFTEPKQAKDYALLRAAEITKEYGFNYFTILGQGDASTIDRSFTAGTSYTTGSVSPYSGTFSGTTTYTPRTTAVYKPGTELKIRCYNSCPTGHIGIVYDASAVQVELRAKYKLTATSATDLSVCPAEMTPVQETHFLA